MTRPAATILIVDDELQNRKLLEVLLKPEGYLTLSAANGEEALALIAQRAPDLILLDIMMPGMDGYQVASTLKATPATANIPIIMVSAQLDRSARLEGLNAGAEEFLTKPVDRAELWLRVRNLLRLKSLGDFLQHHSSILDQQMADQTAQLRESEERNRAIVDTVADAIIVIDERGAMQRFNHGAERMFGYAEAEVVGKNVALLMPSPDREQHDGYLARFLATGEKRVIGIGREVIARRKDGAEFPADLAVAEMRLGESRMFTGIIRDITEARRAAEQKVQLMASLEATNKELESFSYSVSHDLRGPLRSMDGFSLVLLEDYGGKLDDEGKDALQRIRAASQRMGYLIDDLLRLSQVTRAELKVTRVDLSAIARDIADALEREQSSRSVEWVIESGLSVRADPALTRIAMQNLLQNAWKFTGRTERAVIRVGALERDAKTVYFVADNGVGFDMAHAGSLFGAFQRLHHVDDFPGTGIGLTIVQRIIRRHGGEIRAEAEEGKGATFFFSVKEAEKGSNEQDHPAG